MKSISLILFILIVFSKMVFCQNLSEKYTLKFNLEGNTENADFGLDSKKSYWKVKFWLRLVDEETSVKNAVDLGDEKAMAKAFKKKFKPSKFGIFVAKGEFKKINISDSQNREVILQLTMPDKIKGQSLKGTYSFFLAIKSEVRTGLIKKKIKSEGEFPIKLETISNEMFGMMFKVNKMEDGVFTFGAYRQ